jgi:hypothetical protein
LAKEDCPSGLMPSYCIKLKVGRGENKENVDVQLSGNSHILFSFERRDSSSSPDGYVFIIHC